MHKKLLALFLFTFMLAMPGLAIDGRYGPVKRSDTLWEIAEELRPSSKVTVQQMMLALYRANPQAFAANNINSLMKDVYLQVPDLETINAYSRNSAIKETRLQNQRWKKGIYKKNPNRYRPPEIQEANQQKATEAETHVGVNANKPLVDQPQLPATTDAGAIVAAVEKPETLVNNESGTPESLPQTVTRLRSEVADLKQQLAESEAENQLLLAELGTLKSVQNTARQQQAKPDPVIVEQVKLLESELDELKILLTQKDNHIKTLQSNLKEASQAIKSQHADNMRLYNMLKSLSAQLDDEEAQQQLANNQTGRAAPKLQLAGVPDSLEPANTANTVSVGEGSVWADETAPTASHGGIVQTGGNTQAPTMQVAGSAAGADGTQGSGILRRLNQMGISPISLIVAILSLFFILFMVFQSIMYRRTLERIVDDSMESRRQDRQEEYQPIPAQPVVQQPPPLPDTNTRI